MNLIGVYLGIYMTAHVDSGVSLSSMESSI